LNRYSLPRTITPEQQEKMVEFLIRYPPHQVRITFAKDNPEALQYAADLSGILAEEHGKVRQGWIA
jgi:hypothetical protein